MADKSRRPQFGNRLLNEHSDDVFSQNAWDHVQWQQQQFSEAESIVQQAHDQQMTCEDSERCILQSCTAWDRFYSTHSDKFFQDRHWLFTEFTELSGDRISANDDWRIWEVGCGAGNTVFPLLAADKEGVIDESARDDNHRRKKLFIYASDFSEKAVSLVISSPQYDPDRCHAFVHDITANTCLPFAEASIDCIVLVFVLSAVARAKHSEVFAHLTRYLRPGGWILFRDYGRLDLAQLRFKPGRCLGDNTYARGDGTLVYFFSREDLGRLAEEAGLRQVQCFEDRRLQVNRARQLKMYRVWIQAKLRKPLQNT